MMTVTNSILALFSFFFTFSLLPNTISSLWLKKWCSRLPFPEPFLHLVNIHYKTRGGYNCNVETKEGEKALDGNHPLCIGSGNAFVTTNNNNAFSDNNNFLEYKNMRPNAAPGLYKSALRSLIEHHKSIIGHHHITGGGMRAKNINLSVSQDGSTEFETIQEALNAAMMHREKIKHQTINIHIKAGTYKEYLDIKVPNLRLLGAGMGKTIITGDMIKADENNNTEETATVTVSGKKGTIFVAQGITFRNPAGLNNKKYSQAVALRSNQNNSVFYKCSFEGYQNTLFADSGNQFYRECSISGSVDFIFGNALAIFQRCNIIARPSKRKKSSITAQGRENPEQNTGFIFQNCKIHPSDELRPLIESKSKKLYLGRPWKMFSRAIVLNSNLEGIHEQGWSRWNNTASTDHVEYAEFGNTGAGASTNKRVKWKNFPVLKSWEEAKKYTLGGGFWHQFEWLETTNVPFNLDL